MSDLTASWRNAQEVGGCNNCTERVMRVLEVRLERGLSFRLCLRCLFELDAARARASEATGITTAKRRLKRQTVEELRASDLTAQEAGREDIEYGHHEMLPRGEHVARRVKE